MEKRKYSDSDAEEDDAFVQSSLQKQVKNVARNLFQNEDKEIDKPKYVCEKCKLSFNKKYNLDRHIKGRCQSDSNKKNKWRCTECSLTFYQLKDLKKHVSNAHEITIPCVTYMRCQKRISIP